MARGITLAALVLAAVSGCGDEFDTCEARRACPRGGAGGEAGALTDGNAGNSPLGGGGSSSAGATSGHGGSAGEAGGASGGSGAGGEAGAAGSSGAEAGGAGGEAGAAGSGGAGGALPCDGACAASTPHCDPLSNLCVECLDQPDCASPKPICDSATHTCVACLTQADCTEPSASECELKTHTCRPCTADAHCAGIAGKGVCASGACVECSAENSTACRTIQGTPLVCDSVSHVCTLQKEHSAGLCQPCVSDAHCALGELCVLDTLGSGATQKSVGYFCHWKLGDTANGAPASCASQGRPYVHTVVAQSINGVIAEVCTLRVTSCPAHNEFRNKNCAPSGTPDDTLCGVSPPDDAKCVQFGPTTYRCTITCLSTDDCPSPSTCNIGVSPQVCTL